MKRYTVDERVACAAIVDNFYPNYSQCLDSYSPYIISYFSLPRKGEDEEKRNYLMNSLLKECEELNKNNTITKEECNKLFQRLNELKQDFKRIFPKVYDIQIL